MTQKEEFQKQLDISKGAEIAKEVIKNGLKIEWETDLEKMDFSKLRTPHDILSDKKFKIEYHQLSELNSDSRWPNLVTEMDEAMINLIDFIKAGNKVIPPQIIRVPKIYHEITLDRLYRGFTKEGLDVADGCHRISLAKNLGHIQIPCLVYDFQEEFRCLLMHWVCINGLSNC